MGAGPSGSMAALEAAKRGLDVIMLEEHHVIGDPNHCSGLITKNGIDKLNIKYPSNIVDNAIDAVNFWSPSNEKLTISRQKKGELLVFQRSNLDRVLAEHAEKKNVEIRLDTKVRHLLKTNRKISGVQIQDKRGKNYELKAKIVIDAEGSAARFVREAGLYPPDQNWRMPAMQYELDNVNEFPREFCELYHGFQWAPGFFAWIIPACSGSVRIGVATWNKYKTSLLLKKFYNKHPIASKWFKEAKITKKRGGVVAACGPVSKACVPGFLGVGDCVGQVKATTGGGVNISGFCGRIAGVVATNHISNNMPLENYDRLWKKEFYLELKLMEFYRKIVGRLSDNALNILFHSAIVSKFGEKLNSTQDIDMHGKDLLLAGLTPKILGAGIKISPEVILNSLKIFF
ncbi:MAG: NAD(P)/FAD-dependent oxidoreductase [Candidatus Thorarchaeota archaeon]